MEFHLRLQNPCQSAARHMVNLLPTSPDGAAFAFAIRIHPLPTPELWAWGWMLLPPPPFTSSDWTPLKLSSRSSIPPSSLLHSLLAPSAVAATSNVATMMLLSLPSLFPPLMASRCAYVRRTDSWSLIGLLCYPPPLVPPLADSRHTNIRRSDTRRSMG